MLQINKQNNNQDTGYAIQHIWCLSQAMEKGAPISPDGMVSSQIVGAST